jgi:threonine/homoserine/homoserine lactone efflux protein
MPTLTPLAAVGMLDGAVVANSTQLPPWLRWAGLALLVWLVYQWLTR